MCDLIYLSAVDISPITGTMFDDRNQARRSNANCGVTCLFAPAPYYKQNNCLNKKASEKYPLFITYMLNNLGFDLYFYTNLKNILQ